MHWSYHYAFHRRHSIFSCSLCDLCPMHPELVKKQYFMSNLVHVADLSAVQHTSWIKESRFIWRLNYVSLQIICYELRSSQCGAYWLRDTTVVGSSCSLALRKVAVFTALGYYSNGVLKSHLSIEFGSNSSQAYSTQGNEMYWTCNDYGAWSQMLACNTSTAICLTEARFVLTILDRMDRYDHGTMSLCTIVL